MKITLEIKQEIKEIARNVRESMGIQYSILETKVQESLEKGLKINSVIIFLDYNYVLKRDSLNNFDALVEIKQENYYIHLAPKYRLSQYERRKSFTLAHELGHIFLEHILTDEDKLYRDSISINSKDNNEIEANYFASVLLLPDELVDKYLKTFGETGMDSQAIFEAITKVFTSTYDVSKEIIRYRLLSYMEEKGYGDDK